MREKDVIHTLLKLAPRSRAQLNRPFESDAEIVEVNGQILALTVDEYSEEDMLGHTEPALLGHNLAVATVSDLLAVGADPLFHMHSVVVTDAMDRAFLAKLSGGIQEVLEQLPAHLLGGDVGTGPQWRYTGFAIGTFADGIMPLSRLLCHDEGVISVTGTLGDTNAAALLGVQAPPFEIRSAESRMIRELGGACIDTSDGLVPCLSQVATLNPDIAFVVDMEAIPYADSVFDAARTEGVPKEAFLFGGAGEYELLSYTAEGHFPGDNSVLRPIGRFSRREQPGLYLESSEVRNRLDTEDLPDPRDSSDRNQYILAILRLAERFLG